MEGWLTLQRWKLQSGSGGEREGFDLWSQTEPEPPVWCWSGWGRIDRIQLENNTVIENHKAITSHGVMTAKHDILFMKVWNNKEQQRRAPEQSAEPLSCFPSFQKCFNTWEEMIVLLEQLALFWKTKKSFPLCIHPAGKSPLKKKWWLPCCWQQIHQPVSIPAMFHQVSLDVPGSSGMISPLQTRVKSGLMNVCWSISAAAWPNALDRCSAWKPDIEAQLQFSHQDHQIPVLNPTWRSLLGPVQVQIQLYCSDCRSGQSLD